MQDEEEEWMGGRGGELGFRMIRGILRASATLTLGTASAARAVLGFAPLRSALRVVLGAVALGLAALAVDATCFTAVPHGFVGVKQIDVGERGIVAADYPPGLVFQVPLAQSVHLVDARTHVWTFAEFPEAADAPWIEVRTREGDVVRVGASVVYRVKRGEAWRLVAEGLKNAWTQRVRASAESVLPRELGKLSSSEISTTEARSACAERLREVLGAELAAEHVEVERVLVSQVGFGPEYEKKLQAKQLAVQQERLRQAAAEAEERRARHEIAELEIENRVRAIAAEWDLRIAERASQGRSEIAAIREETRFYADTRKSAGKAEHDRLVMQGDRALAQAEALKDSLMLKALAGAGGRYWLAQRAAANLNIGQVTLDPGDPRVPSVLDLDGMVKLLVGAPVAASVPK